MELGGVRWKNRPPGGDDDHPIPAHSPSLKRRKKQGWRWMEWEQGEIPPSGGWDGMHSKRRMVRENGWLAGIGSPLLIFYYPPDFSD